MPLPNRLALYLTAAGDLVAAVAPFVIDFGGSEKVIAYTGTIVALNAVIIQWLQGWQKYEARQALKDEQPLNVDPIATGTTLHNS